MKALFFPLVCSLIFLSSCASQKNNISIPANNSIEISYSNFDVFEASIKNKSLKDLEISVVSKMDNQQVKGFGLGMQGSADVTVENENKLVISNSSNQRVKIKLAVNESVRPSASAKNNYISFTLENTSAKSIPLIIPEVMNPNLSPFSKSGVDLKIGQELLFREKGKTYILLTVDESIKDGDVLDVPALLKKKRKELGLK